MIARWFPIHRLAERKPLGSAPRFRKADRKALPKPPENRATAGIILDISTVVANISQSLPYIGRHMTQDPPFEQDEAMRLAAVARMFAGQSSDPKLTGSLIELAERWEAKAAMAARPLDLEYAWIVSPADAGSEDPEA